MPEDGDSEVELTDDVKAIMKTGEKQLKRAKRVLTEWKKKTIGRWFKKWQINSVHILVEKQKKQMEDKLKQSENKIKLNNAKSELALARMEVDAWRRAKKEKDALVRKMASKSLQKVKAKLSNRIRIGMEKWKRFVAIHRREELQEVSKAAQKTTRDLSAYKAAIREEKKRRRQAEKSVKELTEQLKEAKRNAASRPNDGREKQRGQAEAGQRDGGESLTSLKRTSSMTSNNSSLTTVLWQRGRHANANRAIGVGKNGAGTGFGRGEDEI